MRQYWLLFFLVVCSKSISQSIDKAYIDSTLIDKVALKAISVDKDINALSRQLFRLSQAEALQTYQYIDSVYGSSDYIRINTLDNLASAHHRIGNNLKSRDFNLIGLHLAKTHHSIPFLFKYNELLSYHYFDRAITDSATFYINEAEKLISEYPKQLGRQLPVVYNRKSQIEGQLGNYEKRDEYMDLTVASLDTIEDYPQKAYFLGNVVYHYKVTKNYSKHAYFSNKLRRYYLKKNDYNIPELHTSLTSMLTFEDSDNYIKELQAILKDPKMDEKSVNHDVIATSLAEAYVSNKRFKAVINLLSERTLDRSSTMRITDRILNLINLEDAYENLGDYENAFKTLDYRKILQDSVRREEVMDRVANYEVKYETERKEAQLKLVSVENEKNKQQKQLFSIIAIGAIIASAVIGFLFFTNRKKKLQLEQQKKLLEKTIDEKNILLRETHHRVKNSFQIVSSLLYLQSESVEDKEAKIAIKEAENRVRSMVLIHQKLYNKDELVGINTEDYFSDLVKDIFESHQFKSEPIAYQLDIEPLVLDIETITPVGLILNELIVNTLKHAFDDITSNSKIDILFNKQGQHLELRVIDNGKGFEGEVKQTSFGITLMKALSKKLNATLDYRSQLNKGTEAKLIMRSYSLL